MIVDGTIGVFKDNDTEYQFNFEDSMVILNDHHATNVVVLTFAEWSVLTSRWIEAYKNWLNLPYPIKPSQSTRNEEIK